MSDLSRALSVGCLAAITLVVTAQSVEGLDGCYSALSVEAHPLCCEKAATDRVETPEHGCCKGTSIAERTASGTTSSSPLVAAAAVQTLPVPTCVAPPGVLARAGVRLDRPPERSGPASTTVLLI